MSKVLFTPIHRQEVIESIRAHYPERLTSTQYRSRQPKEKQTPSYQKLLQWFGSWEEVSRAVWGMGSYIQTWDQAKITQSLLALSAEPLSSHGYLQLRNERPECERQQYPTYEMILRHFKDWADVVATVWQTTAKPRKFWTSKDEMIQLLQETFSKALTSSQYTRFLKEHPEVELPSFPVLQKWFGSWREVAYQAWGVLDPIWTPQTMLVAVHQAFPERITSTIYNQAQAKTRQLPNHYMISKHFGSWVAFSEALWGEKPHWTPERAIEAIQAYFQNRPTAAIYREETVGQQGELILPTTYHCEQLFGSWDHAMAIAFEGEPMSFKSVEPRPRLSEEELVHLMRQVFSHRPTYEAYAKESQKYWWLPNVKTYANRFGTWELAMQRCYPNESGFNRGQAWTLADFLTCFKQASEALGEQLSPTTYQVWQQGQDRAPALSTITNHFGSFAEAFAQIGVSVSSIPRWSEAKVHQQLGMYFKSLPLESQTFPVIYDYLDVFNQQQQELPSLSVIRRMYGGWRQAVRYHCPTLSEAVFKDYDLKQTVVTCQASLKMAYDILGDPLTRTRYESYHREQAYLGDELASAYQIVTRFGSWKQALEAAGIEHLHYTHAQAQLGKQLYNASQVDQAKTETLGDFLDWCLD